MKSKATVKRLRDEVNSNRNKVIAVLEGKCKVCDFAVEEMLEVHHILPLSKGGTNEWFNLALLCPNCHKAIHIWIDQKDGSKTINGKLRNEIGWEQYERLANLLRRYIEFNNERVKKITDFWGGSIE